MSIQKRYVAGFLLVMTDRDTQKLLEGKYYT